MFAAAVRKYIPRNIRNFFRAPAKALKYFFSSLHYALLHRGLYYRARPDWGFWNHPVSYQAFRANHEVPEWRDEMDEFVRFACPDMVLYDIGAHFGFYTLAALHYGGARARVVAVDPSTEAGKIFMENMKLNNAGSRVLFIQKAAGSSAEVRMLPLGAFGEYMMMTVEGRDDAAVVKGVTLDSLVESAGLRPTHVKIDVEGYERQVIEGGVSTLKKHRPIIFLELHVEILRKKGENPEEILLLLDRMGYCFTRKNLRLERQDILGSFLSRFVCVPDRDCKI